MSAARDVKEPADSKCIDVTRLPAHPRSASKGGQTTDIEFEVKEETIYVVAGGKTLNIFSRQTFPNGSPRLTVLLLHGQLFTSKNWEDIGTLQLLASWGYRAVGVDLPGYGKSAEVSLGGTNRGDFLQALVETLKVKPVIVSPSMSGGFSLPYLFDQPQQSTQRAAAYVPVAPVSTGLYKEKYPHSQLPTLIVYGSNDTSLGFTSLEDLKALPNAQIAKIPDADHPCYLNQPALFHNVLHHFLSDLSA